MRVKNGQTTKGEKLSQYESVKNWFESLEASAVAKGKPLSRRSRLVRLRNLAEYVQLNGLNPDQLMQGARADKKDAMTRLTNFFNWLQGANIEGKQRKTHVSWNAATTAQAYLRGFYTHNDISFPKRFKSPARKVSEVTKRDVKTEIYSYDEETDEIVYKNGCLQHFLSNLNFRDQTIALCLLSTGADAADLLALNVGFVKDDKGKISGAKRFLWKGNRLKDGIEFKVYMSAEASAFLKRYCEQERANEPDKAPLFVEKDGSGMNAHALAINFRTAASKFLKVESNESNPFRPKRFRHLFRSAAGNAHMDVGFTHAMMGHASDVSGSYLEKGDGNFLREYVKLEPYVTVFGAEKNGLTELTEEMRELGEKVQKTEAELVVKKDQISSIVLENKALRERVISLENQVQVLFERASFLSAAMPEGVKSGFLNGSRGAYGEKKGTSKKPQET
jgi:integrase